MFHTKVQGAKVPAQRGFSAALLPASSRASYHYRSSYHKKEKTPDGVSILRKKSTIVHNTVAAQQQLTVLLQQII